MIVRRSGDPLPPFLAYPRFLLAQDINDTAKLVYILLLDRSRMSERNEHYEDEGGLFVYFTVKELAKQTGRGQSVIHQALAERERRDLIQRRRAGGRGSRIYVKCPSEKPETSENRSSQLRKTGTTISGKPEPNKKERKNYKRYDYRDTPYFRLRTYEECGEYSL